MALMAFDAHRKPYEEGGVREWSAATGFINA
jgi:hypothetical protein